MKQLQANPKTQTLKSNDGKEGNAKEDLVKMGQKGEERPFKEAIDSNHP